MNIRWVRGLVITLSLLVPALGAPSRVAARALTPSTGHPTMKKSVAKAPAVKRPAVTTVVKKSVKNSTSTKAASSPKSRGTEAGPPAPKPIDFGAPVAGAPMPPSSVEFTRCDAVVECAQLRVPLDPGSPAGEMISLHVSRRRATDPAKRRGVLFMNPGGPGSPAFDIVRSASVFLIPDVLARYDVVGVDPRGTERSTPIRCGGTAVGSLGSVPLDRSLPQADQVRARYGEIARSCELTEAKMIPFLDTPTNAADLDAVRVALGEERISFLGLSYGTYLGAVYQTRYPGHSARFVLDSAITPTRFGSSLLIDRAAAHETALDGFLEACATGRLKPCRFNDGTDLRAKYLGLRADVTAASPSGSRGFDSQVGELVGFPGSGWPILGRGLQELVTIGRANFNELPADDVTREDREVYLGSDVFSEATNLAVNCRDGILPRNPEAFTEITSQISVVAPRFTGLAPTAALASLTCPAWPAATLPVATFAPNGVATLVIANHFDLTTPLSWSQALATQLGAGVLLREGGGHVATDKSACVKLAVAHFLIDSPPPPVTSATCQR